MANPTLLDMPIAVDGDKNTIPTTTTPTTGLLSQQYGWRDINSMPVTQGGKAPNRKDFNGVFNLISNILFYCQKGWQFEWDSSQVYYAGCIVKDTTNGKMYRAKNDVSASATHPSADSTNWELFDLLTLLANYLPLTGGIMTGTLKTKDVVISSGSYVVSEVGDGSLGLWGGEGPYSGANLTLFGAYLTDGFEGVAELRAFKRGQDTTLLCYPDGRMTWGNNDLAGSAIVGESLTESGYKKNADGLIIQWGAVASGTSSTVTLPIAFTTRYNVVASSSSDVLAQVTTKTDSLSQFTIRSDNACAKSWFAIGV